MIRWLMGFWYARLRQIDLNILWPICKREASNHRPDDWLNHAKGAFALHCLHDRAWTVLGDDEVIRRIDALT